MVYSLCSSKTLGVCIQLSCKDRGSALSLFPPDLKTKDFAPDPFTSGEREDTHCPSSTCTSSLDAINYRSWVRALILLICCLLAMLLLLSEPLRFLWESPKCYCFELPK
jgi:hypothetical protein